MRIGRHGGVGQPSTGPSSAQSTQREPEVSTALLRTYMSFEIKAALKWKKATTAMVTFSAGMMKPRPWCLSTMGNKWHLVIYEYPFRFFLLRG
jgi:hypothetical protein